MAELVVTTSEGTVYRYRLGPLTVIGRHPDCDIVITDPMASRRHCKVERTAGGQFFVEDNGSANGTIFNAEYLRGRKPLGASDRIQIGATQLALKLDDPAAEKKPHAAQDPNLSIVRLKEDLAGPEPAFDYTMAAGGTAVTFEEESSSDLALLKSVTQRLKVLLDMGQALGASLRPRAVLQTCLEKLFEVFPQAERGFILLFGPEGQIPSSIASEQKGADDLEGRQGPLSVSKIRNPVPGQENEVAVSRTVINRVRAGRQSVLLSDEAGGEDYNPAMSLARLEVRSVICSPLVADSEDLGILYLDTKDAARRFGRDDLNLLNAIAGQAAMVIKNAELARQAAAEAASRQNLQRFLSPHLVDQIIKKEMTVELGGSLKHGTVFFSDVVGFTRLASQMRPADVVTLLNRYFTVMQEIIFARGGTVDKTGGDAIMAYWGVLVDTPSAAANAAAAALEMQNAIFALNRKLAAAKDLVQPPEPLGHGIGLNTGEFIAGNIGSERKIEFTIVGNSVNLAQRIGSIAGRGQVFIGQGTFEKIKERALAIRMPDCPVKNLDQPIRVYSLRGIIPPDATGSGLASSNPTGQTSRVDPGAQEMLYNLPCSLLAEGRPDIAAVVTRMALSRAERRGRLHVLADQPRPEGARLKLIWKVTEKPNLSPLTVEVERSWVPEGAPDPDPDSAGEDRSAREILQRPSTSLIGVEHAEGSMILRAAAVPDDLLAFRPGEAIPSDLTSHEQVVRA